ncbi:MAG: type II toxin-antitoxin system RelE/ParE family toxin [Chitinophagaceae bacterium]
MAFSIKWNRRAINHFDEAIENIQKNSPANAQKVKNEILLQINSLLKHTEKYNPDKYKTNNDGNFRAFEIHHFPVSYRCKGTDIRIIRIRHTKMNPLEY